MRGWKRWRLRSADERSRTWCSVHTKSLLKNSVGRARRRARPQTEDSIERGFRGHEAVDDEFGRSESLDPDVVGDIG